MSRKPTAKTEPAPHVRRLGPPGPSLYDQAMVQGARAAQDVDAEVERLADYVANVVARMAGAVRYGVDVELGGPDDTEGTGLRNLTEEDAGAIVGVLRTMQVMLANVDVAVARIVGEQPLAAQPRESWPVSL